VTLRRIGILGLQGDVAEHRAALEYLGAMSKVVRDPVDLVGIDGLIVPGGESTTISRLALDLGMLDPVRESIADGLPTLGTCAGMILLAHEVLDGRRDQEQFGGINMTVRRNAFGRQVDSFEADVALPLLGEEPFRAVFIRAPWVEKIGAEVEVLARVRSGDGPDQQGGGTDLGPSGGRIVAVRQDAVIATSFHPELTHDYRIHELLLKMIG
jgi:5'-phosphate synthase pdxT subunit